jgi:thioredoxin
MENLKKETFIKKVWDFETNKEWKFEGQRPCVIDFYADWCNPCRQLTPILERLSKEDLGIDIYKVNVDDNHDASVVFGIKSIPTMIYCNENGYEKTVGLQSAIAIKEKIKTL